MNDDPFADIDPAGQATPAGNRRAEWPIIAGLAGVVVVLPLALGLAFSLALNDSISVHAGDPLHEARLWLVQERAGATGLALSVNSPRNALANQPCAETRVHILKWDGGLRLEPEAAYCQCYEMRNGSWTNTSQPCPTP